MVRSLSALRPETMGRLLLGLTTLGWGLNWPAMKLLLQELPPLTARGTAGVAAGLALGAIAAALGVRLAVPVALWPRLVLISLLNVTAWMGLATFSLLWLAAGEATIVCYTMPVWASLLAWPVLGERPSLRRLGALALALTGLALLVLGQGVSAGIEKLPGVAFGLSAALLFSLGTVITKRWPVVLPPMAGTAWQVGLGCLPLLLLAPLLEQPEIGALSGIGWAALAYMAVGPLCLCYLAWFAALRRLPASVAAVGTLIAPVVGVTSAALVLGEPLGPRELGALAMTVGGIVLAVRG